MPLVEITELKVGNFLGVWSIDEDEQELRQQLTLDQGEIDFLNSVTNEARRVQWLASRVLIRTIVKPPGQILMDWNKLGQPIVLNYDFKVSISHCKQMAAAIVGDRDSGVDIELASAKVERIAKKFVRDDEFEFIPKHLKQEYYMVIWAAKEALFKMKGGGGIDFKEHLRTLPFLMEASGHLKINYQKGGHQTLDAFYQWIEGHILVWILKTS